MGYKYISIYSILSLFYSISILFLIQPFNSSPSYLIRLPFSLNTAHSTLLSHLSPAYHISPPPPP